MAHKPEKADVDTAFERFKELTGDATARLRVDGAYYWLEAKDVALEGYGKATMLGLLTAFCEGVVHERARIYEAFGHELGLRPLEKVETIEAQT